MMEEVISLLKNNSGGNLSGWDNWIRWTFKFNIITFGKGHLIGIDRDVQALEICKKRTLTKHSNFSLLKGSYSSIQNILDQLGVLEVNGMLLDLGLSSFQLDNHEDFHLKQMEILI